MKSIDDLIEEYGNARCNFAHWGVRVNDQDIAAEWSGKVKEARAALLAAIAGGIDGLAMAKRIEELESNLVWLIDNVDRSICSDSFERGGSKQDVIARLEEVRRADELELAKFNAKYLALSVLPAGDGDD